MRDTLTVINTLDGSKPANPFSEFRKLPPPFNSLEKLMNLSEQELLKRLEIPSVRALPQGISYRKLERENIESINRSTALEDRVKYPTVVTILAHGSGDLFDFVGGAMKRMNTPNLWGLAITEGEKGAEHLTPDETRRTRLKENIISASILDIQIEPPTDYEYIEDGDVPNNIEKLRDILVKRFKKYKPEIIILHPLPQQVDANNPSKIQVAHGDHEGSTIAALLALEKISKEGYEQNCMRIPTVYFEQFEFLHGSGGNWAKNVFSEALPDYPRRVIRHDNQVTESLFRGPQYFYDPISHFIQPVQSGITSINPTYNLNYLLYNPVAISHYLVDVTPVIHDLTSAFFALDTQINEYSEDKRTKRGFKDYVVKIPAAWRLQGLLQGGGFAQGFSLIYIPGVTSPENRMALYLPEGSMSQLSLEKSISRRSA